MAKRLFLLLIVSFIGVFNAPDILMASDSFDLVGLNNAGITETVPIIEKHEEEPVQEAVYEAPVYVEPVYTAPIYVAPEPVYVAPANSISIAGRTIEIIDVADTSVDAGNHVNKYGPKFLYGHNSAAVFGNIVSMGVGSRFSVTYGGVVTNYVVAKTVIYEKNTSTGTLQLNGAGSYMRSVANARSEGVVYDISLMTCYGTSYGNGDASHRFVIFANAV